MKFVFYERQHQTLFFIPKSCYGLRFSLKNFSFSETVIILLIKLMILLSVITYGKILDKISLMSVAFFCNFRNFVFIFLVKFDRTISLIRKLS
jgi:hypothetical protein